MRFRLLVLKSFGIIARSDVSSERASTAQEDPSIPVVQADQVLKRLYEEEAHLNASSSKGAAMDTIDLDDYALSIVDGAPASRISTGKAMLDSDFAC